MAIELAFGSQIRLFLHLNFYQPGLTCFDRNCKKKPLEKTGREHNTENSEKIKKIKGNNPKSKVENHPKTEDIYRKIRN